MNLNVFESTLSALGPFQILINAKQQRKEQRQTFAKRRYPFAASTRPIICNVNYVFLRPLFRSLRGLNGANCGRFVNRVILQFKRRFGNRWFHRFAFTHLSEGPFVELVPARFAPFLIRELPPYQRRPEWLEQFGPDLENAPFYSFKGAERFRLIKRMVRLERPLVWLGEQLVAALFKRENFVTLSVTTFRRVVGEAPVIWRLLFLAYLRLFFRYHFFGRLPVILCVFDLLRHYINFFINVGGVFWVWCWRRICLLLFRHARVVLLLFSDEVVCLLVAPSRF